MKILIGTPVYNHQLDSRMVSTVLNVIKEARQNNWSIDWDRPSSCLLSYNRNLIVQNALKNNFDWILFIDSDIQVKEENWVSKLIDTAHKNDSCFVGVPVRLKTEYSKTWNFYIKGKNWEGELPLNPIECELIGTGIALIYSHAFQKIIPPWFEQLDTYTYGKIGFWPEDFNFCEKIRTLSRPIMMDPRIKAIHWGQYPYE